MRIYVAGILVALFLSPRLEADDEKLAKRVDQLTSQLVKNLEDLAKKYDGLGDPEAAHFLASCAVGFGSKDAKVAGIKGSREVDVFLARLRGGEQLADGNPIDTALRGIAFESRKVLDSLLPQLKKGELSTAAKNLAFDLAPKYEIARGAKEYIQATQRFNRLRREMGLRGILWDFENSRQLILACLYMGETEDYRTDDVSDRTSPFYTDAVELARTQTVRMVLTSLPEYPGDIRSFALVRQELLNPDARQLWLAHWSGGRRINPMSVYAIPQVGFRQDIPTPSERYSRETVVEAWPGWKDTEDTVALGGAKVPVVRYPYEGESDAPNVFSNGRGGLEAGWAKTEHDSLGKAGLPIMLRVFSAGQPTNVQVDLSAKAGKKIPTRIYLGGDKRVNINPKWITVLALPEVQLEPGSEYSISVALHVGETPIQRSWTFKTRPK